jgi:hypothetical protein
MTEGQQAGLLTIEQKDSLIGVQYISDVYYNPVLNIDGLWCLSMEEIDNTTNENYLWVKDLTLIPYFPPLPPVTGTTI